MKKKSVMTLDRVLSRFGFESRTMAQERIRAGRVKVNGRVVNDPDLWVRPGRDIIDLDGRRLKRVQKIYLLFYKPKGVITSHGDPWGRATVYDYLDERLPWVVPVGRLDKDSTGLLLLTNDTDFANLVMDPASGIPKTYLVKLNGIMSDEAISTLAGGVRMTRGDWARPRSIRRLEDRGKYTRLEVVLEEGKNREVRRMMEAAGFKVLKLVRTAIGPLTIGDLEIGNFRRLTAAEVASLTRRSQESEVRIQNRRNRNGA